MTATAETMTETSTTNGASSSLLELSNVTQIFSSGPFWNREHNYAVNGCFLHFVRQAGADYRGGRGERQRQNHPRTHHARIPRVRPWARCFTAVKMSPR